MVRILKKVAVWGRWVAAGIGATSVILLVRQVGWIEIQHQWALAGLGLGWILALNFPRFFIYGIAWHGLARRLGQPLSLARAVTLKWIGEAIGEATPLHVIGGDASRLALLYRGRGPFLQGSASVVLDRSSHILAGLLFSSIGIGCFLTSFEIAIPSWGWMVAGIIGLAAGVGVAVRWIGVHPLVRRGVRLLWRERRALLIAASICFVGKLLVSVELLIIIKCLGLPLGVQDIFILGAMGLILVTVLPFLPAGLGAIEGGVMAFFQWRGIDPALGLSLQLIRRLNGIFMILCGTLLLLFLRQQKKMEEPADAIPA